VSRKGIIIGVERRSGSSSSGGRHSRCLAFQLHFVHLILKTESSVGDLREEDGEKFRQRWPEAAPERSTAGEFAGFSLHMWDFVHSRVPLSSKLLYGGTSEVPFQTSSLRKMSSPLDGGGRRPPLDGVDHGIQHC
jgi:hypothetical protein